MMFGRNVFIRFNVLKLLSESAVEIGVTRTISSSLEVGKKIFVGVIYRHPNYNFQEFPKCLTTTLLNFKNAKCEYIICGDININLLSSSSNKRVATYIETLLSNECT